MFSYVNFKFTIDDSCCLAGIGALSRRMSDLAEHADGERLTGWRGSREGWLAAAEAAFLDSGIDAVKIQPLAASLDLSRTSFYWFFKDRAALLDALFQRWEDSNGAALLAACDEYADTIAEAMLNIIAVFLDENRFKPRFDFAIRGWAHQSDPIMARVAEADDQRLSAIRGVFRRFGFDPAEADVRARTVYLVQMGYIALQVQEDLPTRLQRVPDYVTTFAGNPARPTELARFRARFPR